MFVISIWSRPHIHEDFTHKFLLGTFCLLRRTAHRRLFVQVLRAFLLCPLLLNVLLIVHFYTVRTLTIKVLFFSRRFSQPYYIFVLPVSDASLSFCSYVFAQIHLFPFLFSNLWLGRPNCKRASLSIRLSGTLWYWLFTQVAHHD